MTIIENSSDHEVSFANKSLKLDTEEDAQPIVDAIVKCPHMTTLRLEGNTIGWEAAKAIAKALQGKKEFSRALWKDMFTSRSVQEIPKALNFLSTGPILANAQLTELDLSDNAFGPIGIRSIMVLLESMTCYTLKILRLNNNGLGPQGAKLLAEALVKNHKQSTESGKPLQLQVFICGRNRLENVGATAMAEFVKNVGTLEHVEMPQNGIYHPGISAMSEALAHNPNLREINLNDNTFSVRGSVAFAQALRQLPNLEMVNIGDCLVRTRGAEAIAAALRSHPSLKTLHMGYNEILEPGGLAVAKAVLDKPHLQHLDLDGNYFGDSGCESIRDLMKKAGRLDKLLPLTGDEGSDLEEGDEEEEETNEDESEVQEEDEEDKPVSKFLQDPSYSVLKKMMASQPTKILEEMEAPVTVEKLIQAFMKVGSVLDPQKPDTLTVGQKAADILLKKAFSLEQSSQLNDLLLWHLGLLKSEERAIKPPADTRPHFLLLHQSIKKDYFSPYTREVLQTFLSRPTSAVDSCADVKNALLQTLFQF